MKWTGIRKKKKRNKGTKDIYEWPEEKGLSGENGNLPVLSWYCGTVTAKKKAHI